MARLAGAASAKPLCRYHIDHIEYIDKNKEPLHA